MKVLFVNPPIRNMIKTNLPSFVDEERGYYPPLGIMYVAAYAEKYSGAEIGIYDMIVEEASGDDLVAKIKAERPGVVGITVTTFTLLDALAVARIVKNADPGITVIFGGPHGHIFPDETAALDCVDYLVVGEGEITFTELLKNLGDYDALKDIKGLVYKHEGSIIKTGYRDFIQDLDSLPFPARHLTPWEKYYSLIATKNPITTMFTSRGCPYQCLFCYRPHLGKKFRARSPANVVAEIEQCATMGIREFFIYDDTFTINRKNVLEFCDLLLQKKLDIRFDIRARVNTVDREMLKKLRSAGCERIHFGVESANPRILELLKKGITIAQVNDAFRMARSAGIQTLAYFMIGSPTETREEIMNTIRFAKKLRPDYCHFAVTTPYPATPLYLLMLDKKAAQSDYWAEYARDPTPGFVPMVWNENLSPEELNSLLEYAYKSYYMSPRFVLGKLAKTRSFDELSRYARAGLKMLTR